MGVDEGAASYQEGGSAVHLSVRTSGNTLARIDFRLDSGCLVSSSAGSGMVRGYALGRVRAVEARRGTRRPLIGSAPGQQRARLRVAPANGMNSAYQQLAIEAQVRGAASQRVECAKPTRGCPPQHPAMDLKKCRARNSGSWGVESEQGDLHCVRCEAIKQAKG